MIAARRRRLRPVLSKLAKRPGRWSRSVDRAANRGLERAHPVLVRGADRSRKLARRWVAIVGPRLRPVAAWFFRSVAVGERLARRSSAAAARAATRASAVVSPQRAIGAVIVLAGACLVVSQFLDYRAVEIGQPSYSGLASATRPPTVEIKTAGDAHAYLLVPLGALAILLGVLAIGRDRRRLGLSVAALGLVGDRGDPAHRPSERARCGSSNFALLRG